MDLVKFREQVRENLGSLAENFPKARLLVALLPPFDKLITFDHTYIKSPELSCKTFQRKFCQRALDDALTHLKPSTQLFVKK